MPISTDAKRSRLLRTIVNVRGTIFVKATAGLRNRRGTRDEEREKIKIARKGNSRENVIENIIRSIRSKERVVPFVEDRERTSLFMLVVPRRLRAHPISWHVRSRKKEGRNVGASLRLSKYSSSRTRCCVQLIEGNAYSCATRAFDRLEKVSMNCVIRSRVQSTRYYVRN